MLDKLKALGYETPEIYCMPAQAGKFDAKNNTPENSWYIVIARKPERITQTPE